MESQLESRLDIVRETLLFPPGLVDRLGSWIASAPEEELYRINILRWAAQMGSDEKLVLDLFLHATTAGIVDMVWSTLCTQCGLLITSPGGLRHMSRAKRHCRL
jgi:Family of unknown function (DUF5939)